MAGSSKTALADGELKPLIEESLFEAREVSALTTDSWLRVSALAGLCAREEVICSVDDLVRKDPISPSLMLIFEHGHGLHWDLQNRILPRTDTIFGRWRCAMCGDVRGGQDEWITPLPKDFHDQQVLRGAKCAKCGAEQNSDTSLYVEQWVKNPEFRIAGHPDAFLRVPGMPGMGVLEGKSINAKGAWQVRNIPKMDHVVQAHTYMWLTGCQWAKIVYWNKGGYGIKDALVEHTIEYDEDHVDAIKELIRNIWKGVETGKLPERICGDATCTRASACTVADECFGRD
jgi:hypothetical protein